jgi:hypothetical protein
MKSKKAKLNEKAFAIWKKIVLLKADGKCEVCGAEAQTGHHFFSQGAYSYLKYNTSNGIAICVSCHFKHHTKADPMIHLRIVSKRGQEWLDNLLAIPRPSGTYLTDKWVKENIEKLDKELGGVENSPF